MRKITKRFRGWGIKAGRYKWFYMPWYPNAEKSGRVKEHILKMTQILGRPLKKGEVVHHIDGNPLNNDINNLQLLDSQATHLKIHRASVNTAGRQCTDCFSITTEMNGISACWYSDKNDGWLCKLCYRKRKRKERKLLGFCA